jgi:hypothetical protein
LLLFSSSLLLEESELCWLSVYHDFPEATELLLDGAFLTFNFLSGFEPGGLLSTPFASTFLFYGFLPGFLTSSIFSSSSDSS